ncbi:MAG: TetR/AcrR family transcriptional regulator [Bacillota bacterium]|nr:TetR/AcrR family transcriptional regulator [Bacillota bacterium]
MELKSKKAEETRDRILVSAQKLFYKKGFEKTSIREIVEDAGYAKGTFYLYFETKMDLLSKCVEGMFVYFFGVISSEISIFGEDPFLQMDTVLEKLYLQMVENEGSLRVIHTHEILHLILEEKLSISYMNALIANITVFFKKGIEKGYFRELDPELYGKMIFNMVHEMMESAMLYEYPGDLRTVKEELKVIVRKLLQK